VLARRAQAGWSGRRGALGHQAHDGRLQRAARLEDLLRFLARGHGHGGAAVGPQLHDVVVREFLQHLAHHRAAHAEQLAQRCLGQLGAGRQALAHHALEHGAVDPGLDVVSLGVGQRTGRARRLRVDIEVGRARGGAARWLFP